ncbi:lipocalin-like domain-containing protein [Bradyrhizobium sp. AUGA SZCCT0042]|uniref:lipocalin-like domain-containing protein n=1 Tax=Bradyrhizobium sp. AUGA SZCCT0042 TaxID=2807651 RepID=UPI001BA99B5B|nr:lipocalin-like domain-containing protein [Bradyrhizobium sp. AUGA SZCCT0042]MBR1299826.1 lipocalin-like domain-containing protein [Bradyrhizobium sp. AUGA SZCCT0042]
MAQGAAGRPLNEQLAGAWTLVSWKQTNGDGTKLEHFGENPQGLAFFDTAGHYMISVMRSDRVNYQIENFGQIAQISAEEAKKTALGTITYFGTYVIDGPRRVLAIHVEASSFPNWNGTDQERFFELSQDRLTLTVRLPRGGQVDVLWQRANA